HDCVLAEGGEIDARPQLTTDQPADLVGTDPDATLDRLSVTTRVSGRRQRRVLGRHTAQAGVVTPARHSLDDARGAQHPGVAHLDEHRARRPLLESAGDPHLAELVIVSAVYSHHTRQPNGAGWTPGEKGVTSP